MNAITSIKSFFTGLTETHPAPPYAALGRLRVPVDDPHDEVILARPSPAEAEDGQTFVIDYEDGQGALSHRRISVWGVEQTPDGVPILLAKCHERQAPRAFRLDRIKAVTDLAGRRREPLARFFFDTFGLSWPKDPIIVPPSEPADVRWKRIRALLREAGVPALAALALSDGEMSEKELDEIRAFAERALTGRDLSPTDGERERIAAYVSHLRPTAEAVDGMIDQMLAAGDRAAIADLLRASLKVIGADGVVKEEEAALLDAYCFTLTGVHLC